MVHGEPEVRLAWDEPQPDQETVGEPLRLSGWAFARAGIDAVCAYVDGGAELPAATGESRQDVAKALGAPEAAHSGWSLTLPVSELKAGENRVTVAARARGGRRAAIRRTLLWRDFDDGELRFTWDEPQPDRETVGEPLRLSGWAYAQAGIDAVGVHVNGRAELSAETGESRLDVAKALGAPEAAHSGWSVTVPLSTLRAGENQVTVTARTRDGYRAAATRTLLWRELPQADVRFAWDEPERDRETVGEPLRLAGWAYALEGIEAVCVCVNGGAELSAATGECRQDVAQAVGVPEAAGSGWSSAVPVSTLRSGENHVTVTARTLDGRRATETRTLIWRDFTDGENPFDRLDLTGERYDPRSPRVDSVGVEHRARYALAASLARGRRVVDLGCGLGYGAAAMADAGAVTVEAIDASAPAINVARRDYGIGVRYTIGDIRELPYDDASFDLAVCFEVIEHVLEHDRLLDEIRRVLAPTGVLLISTPNRGSYPADNPWHIRELTTDELARALGERFANVNLLGQQLHLASLLGAAALSGPADSASAFDASVLKLSGGAPNEEVYVVALASDANLPLTQPLVAIGDPRDQVADASIETWSERALAAEAQVAMLTAKLQIACDRMTVPRIDVEDPPPVPRREQTLAALQLELRAPPPWMYEWDLGSAGQVAHRPGRAALESIHHTRLRLITPVVSQALAEAGPGARVLDLGCCEGWFAHRMLELGASSVVGVDVREVNVRRARLVRDHLGIEPARLEFYQADVLALPDLGQFDVVLMLGLIYHLENPMAALRIARALTRSLCLVESQLTEQRTPVMAGNGQSGLHFERPESFAAWFEHDQEDNPLASFGGILSLIPNEAALLAMGRVAGFADVRIAPPSPDHDRAYVRRERAVMIARSGGVGPAAAVPGCL